MVGRESVMDLLLYLPSSKMSLRGPPVVRDGALYQAVCLTGYAYFSTYQCLTCVPNAPH